MSLGSVVTVLVVFTVSILVVDVGTVALTMTGLSRDVARFQALSAFTGTGFTTEEAEAVVASPGRRRVVEILSRVGSIGVVTAIASLVFSFSDHGANVPLRVAVLAVGSVVLVAVMRSETFDRLLTPLIRRVLSDTTDLEIRDYTHLMHLHDGFSVGRVSVDEESELAGETLEELDLKGDGVIVVGVMRDGGDYVGTPDGETAIEAGDEVIAYGSADALDELSTDASGRFDFDGSALGSIADVGDT